MVLSVHFSCPSPILARRFVFCGDIRKRERPRNVLCSFHLGVRSEGTPSLFPTRPKRPAHGSFRHSFDPRGRLGTHSRWVTQHPSTTTCSVLKYASALDCSHTAKAGHVNAVCILWTYRVCPGSRGWHPWMPRFFTDSGYAGKKT